MKEVKKYTVIESLTEESIKSIGISRWIKKYVWWLFLFLFVFVCLAMLSKPINSKIYDYSGMVIMVGVFFSFYYKGIYIEGKKFWNKVKDLPEPIDLREVK